jgi:hypothetical protein
MMERVVSLRFSVWPYFFLACVLLIAAIALVVVWRPDEYPAKTDLVRLCGDIASIVVRDDISGTGVGAVLPGLNAVYFTLKGIQGEFRYPYTHPKYLLVRSDTSDFIEVWVDKTELSENMTVTIWQLREHTSYTYRNPPTFVSYEEVIERQVERDRSYFNLGLGSFVAAAVLAFVGIGLRRLSRQLPTTPPPPVMVRPLGRYHSHRSKR